MTRDLWNADESKRELLAGLLNQSPLKEALAVLVFEGLPKADERIAPNDAVANALQNKEREGYFNFYHKLLALTQRAETAKAPLPQPYAHHARKKATKAEKAEKTQP